MFKKKKNKKILTSLCVLSMVFLQLLPIGTQAATIGSSLTGSTDGVTQAATTVSAITNKQTGPTVDVSFVANNGFKSGALVTATATAGGFLTASDKLYYTWYIKHDGCGLTDNWWKDDAKEDDDTKLKSCDLDGDNLITPNDWKIAAARIIVSGNFDRSDADYSSSNGFVGDDASGTAATPAVTNDWIKNFKRNDSGKLAQENDKDATNCYIEQPTSGVIYELRRTASIFDACPSGYHPSCIKNATAACAVLNPSFSSNSNPFICQLPNPDSSCLYPKAISNDFNACAVKNEDTNANAENVFDCAVKSDDDLKSFTATLACDDNSETPLCTKDSGNTDLDNVDGDLMGRIFSKGKIGTAAENESNGVCATLAKPNQNDDPLDPLPNFLDNSQPLISSSAEDCSTLRDGLVNGVKKDNTVFGIVVSGGTTVANGNTALAPTCTFEKKENLCKHLFPYFPKKSVTVDGKSIDLSNETIGDGKFTLKEKEFWGADPKSDSTNGAGKDEANAMGMGVDSFAWSYAMGDEIGVAVEGTSDLTTDHNDSSYKIMWAFSKNVCSALSEVESRTSIDAGKRAFYTEDDKTVGILTADFDLDRCLDENLMAPDDSGASNIKVELTSTPENPINDPNGTAGDDVAVVASVQNTESLGSLFYYWKIEKSSDGAAVPNENTQWTDITTDMIDKYGSLSSANQQGLGKSTLNFSLNLPADVVDPKGNGVFYLRAKVTATENSGTGGQVGKGVLIIKVQEQQNEIVSYSVVAGDDGNLSFFDGVGGGPICNTKAEKSVCYTTKNKIIGLRVPNDTKDLSGFSWKVNNVQMACSSEISATACSTGDDNALFFPILGNVGESVDVTLNAVSKKTGGTVALTRHFVIVDPQVIINSDNTTSAWAKLLGYYKDLDGNKTPSYSAQVFETNPGQTVKFNAAIYSAWGQTPSFEWSIDGQIQDTTSKQLSFLVDKSIGESYNIGLILTNVNDAAQEKQINNLRKALYKNWGVSPEDSIESDYNTTNIQLNVVENSLQAAASANKTGIFASLITNLPEQIMFLLKILLTSFVIMFSMGLIFSFVPESVFEKTDRESL